MVSQTGTLGGLGSFQGQTGIPLGAIFAPGIVRRGIAGPKVYESNLLASEFQNSVLQNELGIEFGQGLADDGNSVVLPQGKFQEPLVYRVGLSLLHDKQNDRFFFGCCKSFDITIVGDLHAHGELFQGGIRRNSRGRLRRRRDFLDVGCQEFGRRGFVTGRQISVQTGNLAGQARKGGSNRIQLDLLDAIISVFVCIQHVIASVDPQTIGLARSRTFLRLDVDFFVELQELASVGIHRADAPAQRLLQEIGIPADSVDQFIECRGYVHGLLKGFFGIGIRQQRHGSALKDGFVVGCSFFDLDALCRGVGIRLNCQVVRVHFERRHVAEFLV
mmetsp:Transcript_10390/g.26128  ORF Transcript_10390/g.26128 Transcript_10390/m.26128 type:complete len:331 (-) Transcript_10390:267-1259(-)